MVIAINRVKFTVMKTPLNEENNIKLYKGGTLLSYLNDHRVSWEPAPVKAGDKVHLNYDGLLKNSGATDVYVHYGFDGWNNAQTINMSRKSDGIFTAEIPAQAAHEVNICFKDASNNWDNNSGWNWKIDVI